MFRIKGWPNNLVSLSAKTTFSPTNEHAEVIAVNNGMTFLLHTIKISLSYIENRVSD